MSEIMSEQTNVGDILDYIDRKLLAKKIGRMYARYPIIFECERFEHDFYIHLCTLTKQGADILGITIEEVK